MTKKQEKKPVGRPLKIDADTLAKLETAFKIGASDVEACEHAKIHPATLYRYQNENPDFCEQKEAWKRNPILKAKFSVYKGLDDPKLALDYLKLRDDDFSTKVKQEVTNTTPQIVVATDSVKSKIEMLINDANNN